MNATTLTMEDFLRITHCVGVMALSLLKHAENKSDMKEAYELHKLHEKLTSLMENSTPTDSECN